MPYVYQQYHRRKLPHIHAPGATIFVTFRLAGSIPQSVLEEWRQEKIWLEKEIQKTTRLSQQNASELDHSRDELALNFHRRWFVRFEDILHQEACGPMWMKDARIADLIADSLHYRDGKEYRLDVFCIMSNHVHAVFAPLLNDASLQVVPQSFPLRFISSLPTLSAIMQSLKGYTAHEANKILQRTGQFWEVESYDHQIRNDNSHERIIKYVLNNPVKAGLVKDWRDWKWNYQRKSDC